MTKEELDRYLELEKKITEKADEILEWYRENVHPLKGEDLDFEFIEDGLLWYEGYDKSGEGYSLQLPIDLLYHEEAKQEYLNKLEKERELKRHQAIIDEKNKQLEREKAKYERYLELKKEFEA